MAAFQIGNILLGDNQDGPDPGPKNAVWHIVNVVAVKQIPGKGKKFKTIRTSDKCAPTTGTLWECDLTVRSVTDERYLQLKEKCEDGGPFLVVCNHGRLNMYIVDATITHDEKDKEPPMKETDGGFLLNTATWQIKLQEAND
jgi:hypothetical protein